MSPGDLERIIRRATELQFEAGTDTGSGSPLEADELYRIGEEVGLERRYVQQAMAEVQAGSLLPALPEDSSVAERVWGAGFVRATRVVRGDASELDARVAAHFREQEGLRCVRTRPHRTLWEPARGFFVTVTRSIDLAGHGYELAKARSIELAVEPLEPGWSLVTLTADLRNERTSLAAGWHFGLLPVAAAIGVFLGFGGADPAVFFVGTGVAGGSAVVGASWATAAQFRHRKERTETAIQGLLDRLEQGGPLAPERPHAAWRERIPPFF